MHLVNVTHSGRKIVMSSLILMLSVGVCGAAKFDTSVEHGNWQRFACEGYSQTVAGIVFEPADSPCCGVPVGGVGTGCLDIEAGSVIGFDTIFNQYPRLPQRNLPFLGVAIDGKTHVLADKKFLQGGKFTGCLEPHLTAQPMKQRDSWDSSLAKINNVASPQKIHYFGHYPVADIEYELEAPVRVGLRVWSPFIPGDTGASSIPAAVFEVTVVNTAAEAHQATVAINYPGIPEFAVLHSGDFNYQRQNLSDSVKGVHIQGPNRIGYVLGLLGGHSARHGGDLCSRPEAWAAISTELPQADVSESGGSVAVDFEIAGGKTRTFQFVLAWYSPGFLGDKNKHYTNNYATRYDDAVEVANRMARDHGLLLKRVIAWQEAIYQDKLLPGWLADALIQTLCLIPETAYWAAPRGPVGDWAYPVGYFAMNESPRGCSHIECIPCTYYGGLPVTYFYPELNRTTLRAYALMQRGDGAIPFDLGPCCGEVSFVTASHDWQKALNSMCYVDLVDRLWLVTGDRSVVKEFYPAVKAATIYTVAMSANHGEDAVISIPDDMRSEWWEGFDWYGMTAHAGGLRISMMDMAQRMAKEMGDSDFANQCDRWAKQGRASMEKKMWNEKVGSYLLYRHDKLDKQDDTIMSNQFDGEWNNDFHGLAGVYNKKRMDRALETIKKSCIAPFGAVSFAKPDLTPLVTYGIFPPEMYMLGFTYMYEGDKATGLEVLYGSLENLYIKHKHGWDLPNMVSGSITFTEGSDEGREGFHVDREGFGDGRRTFGTDYYQNMMLWSAPAALMGTDLSGPAKKGGLVQRMIDAGKAPEVQRDFSNSPSNNIIESMGATGS